MQGEWLAGDGDGVQDGWARGMCLSGVVGMLWCVCSMSVCLRFVLCVVCVGFSKTLNRCGREGGH